VGGYAPEYAPELNRLYQETILAVNQKDYSTEEVEDWASCGNSLTHWEQLINELYFIVAENNKKQIAGFSSIRNDGYLYSMFVHKDFQRQGIASLLYNKIEEYAITKNIAKITSEVSITAKGFFERQGFKVDEEQKRKANKLSLTNYKMSINLKRQSDETL
jgi:putative acetyltransferase